MCKQVWLVDWLMMWWTDQLIAVLLTDGLVDWLVDLLVDVLCADLKSQSAVVSVDSVKSRVDHAAYIVKSVYRSVT